MRGIPTTLSAIGADRIGRGSVLAVLLALLALAWTAGPNGGEGKSERGVSYGDHDLYAEIAERVAGGESYYAAVTEPHRAHGYPVRPAWTVRFPVVAWLNAWIPAGALLAAGALLLAAGLAAWAWALRARPLAEKLAFIAIFGLTAAPLVNSAAPLTHEFWTGVLVTLALALGWRGCLAFAMLALAFREFPAALIGCAAALWFAQGKRTAAAWAIAVLGVFAAALAIHTAAVSAHILASDLASPGWLGLRGPSGFASDLAGLSWLQLVPEPLRAPLALAPMLGWYAWGRDNWLPFAWFAVFGAALMLAARPDNYYWVLVMLPLYPAGLAFVPRFFRRPGHPAVNRAAIARGERLT